MRNEGCVSVQLPAELREWLRQRAEEELTSQAQIVRRLVALAWRQARDAERAGGGP
jgi:hypothetical protein